MGLAKKLCPPKMPQPWECCGDSCPNCVWTLYFKELEKYNKTKKKVQKKKGWGDTTIDME